MVCGEGFTLHYIPLCARAHVSQMVASMAERQSITESRSWVAKEKRCGLVGCFGPLHTKQNS